MNERERREDEEFKKWWDKAPVHVGGEWVQPGEDRDEPREKELYED